MLKQTQLPYLGSEGRMVLYDVAVNISFYIISRLYEHVGRCGRSNAR